jgi:ribose-phosphate pyrophosphokinase
MKPFFLFGGHSSIDLATKIVNFNARHTSYSESIRLGQIYHTQFPSGEWYCQFRENIRGSDVFLINSTSYPCNDNLMELLVMADAARRASAGRITAIIPYFGYARQDRKDSSREPISAKLVMDLIGAAGINRIVSMDLHAPQIGGFTNLPFDHLHFRPSLIEALKNVKVDVIVSPDVGAVKKAEEYSSKLGIDLAIISKKRIGRDRVESMHFIGEVKDKSVLIIDDLTESAGTLIQAAKKCRENGASKVYCAITHGCFTKTGNDRLVQVFANNLIDNLFVSNTIERVDPSIGERWTSSDNQSFDDKIITVDVAPVFAKAIHSIHHNESVSHLFL